MRLVAVGLVSAVFAGCATGRAATEPTVASPAGQPSEKTEPATPDQPQTPTAPTPTEPCDTQHLWDAQAAACRLHPGGGNGWAGCTLQPGPPTGEACFTGTHWEQRGCDCVCDRAGESWDASGRRCR